MGRSGQTAVRSKRAVAPVTRTVSSDLPKLHRAGTRAAERQARQRQEAYSDYLEQLSVVYVNDQAGLEAALEEIYAYAGRMEKHNRQASVAIDMETASVVPSGSFSSEVAALRLVQLAYKTKAGKSRQFVIDHRGVDMSPLIRLLSDGNVEKVIQNLEFEHKWSLMRFGTPIENIFDTRFAWETIQKHLAEMDAEEFAVAATEVRMLIAEATDGRAGYQLERRQTNRKTSAFHQNNLGELSKRILGIQLPKEEQTGDWGRDTLTSEQVTYAAMDVATLPDLAEITKKVVAKLGIEEKVREVIAGQMKRAAEYAEKDVSKGDSCERVLEAFARARTLEELEMYARTSRQMPVNAVNQPLLAQAYDRRRKQLRAQAKRQRPLAQAA